MRLIGGSTEFDGRVEVCLGNQWGTVCADFFWSDAAAQVICRQKGYPYESKAYTMYISYDGDTRTQVLIVCAVIDI